MSTESKSVKKARNIALYTERNKRLQERQKLANELRTQGFSGNDGEVVWAFERQQRLAAERQQRLADFELRNAQLLRLAKQHHAKLDYVQEALSGPTGKTLVKWLAGRVATYERVSRFFAERPVIDKAA